MFTSVSAIIIRSSDNKTFVTKRSLNKEISPGKWETVGGKVETGENIEQALAREVKEELNVEIKTYQYFGDYQWGTWIFKVFVIELKSEPEPNKDDFEDWGWFTKEEIEKMDFAINCRDKVLDYLKLLSRT
jgi:8-oxo-dGTP diphosphatase